MLFNDDDGNADDVDDDNNNCQAKLSVIFVDK